MTDTMDFAEYVGKMLVPSPEAVTDYAKSIGFSLDGEEFLDYYRMKGWVVVPAKKNQKPVLLSDWRAAVRTWKRARDRWAKENEFATEGASQDEFEQLRKMGCA